MTDGLLAVSNVVIQPLELTLLKDKGLTASVLRLDKVHPVVSGNKWFKLRLYMEEALARQYRSVVTFGGPWSNHILATAYAAQQHGLTVTGIIRGEAPVVFSNTLVMAKAYGMQLQFISRRMYGSKTDSSFTAALAERYGRALIIPEGGFGRPGMKGSEDILSVADTSAFTHIMCCIGTGAMFIGLANSAPSTQQVIGVPVLKGMQALPASILPYLKDPATAGRLKICNEYHFGGYARKTPALLAFMNDLYYQTGIPSDFVYTGKLLYAFTGLAAKNYFPRGSRILIIHSGGLQGNASLPPGTLAF